MQLCIGTNKNVSILEKRKSVLSEVEFGNNFQENKNH